MLNICVRESWNSEAGVSQLFCKKLESKYLGWILGQKVSVITTQLYCHSAKETIDYINKWLWLCSNKTLLWTLEFEFYVIFKCHNISLKNFLTI